MEPNQTEQLAVTQTETSLEIIPAESSNASLEDVSTRLANTLSRFVENMSTLEVKTYVSKDLKKAAQPKLRARTTIRMDGDVEVVIPERQTETGSEIDEKLWELHKETVEMAQDKRIAFIQAVAEVAERLVRLND